MGSAEIIYNFAHKALLQVLPTAANLARWKKTTNPNCILCKSSLPQTNKHVLSNCPSAIALGRYTARHNEILQIIYIWIKSVVSSEQKVLVDLEDGDGMSTSNLFLHHRPDLAVYDDRNIIVLELTICHETNLIKSKDYKINKYRNIATELKSSFADRELKCFSIEVSTLGLISPIDEFCRACKVHTFPDSLKQNIIRATLSSSYKIYCNRNFI